jgi:putative ABC transport system permease protein
MTTATGIWEIIGVMPPGFTYPVGSSDTTDVYRPYVVSAGERARGNSRIQSLDVVGRLKNGVTIEQARARIDQITSPLLTQYPDWFAGATIAVRPLRDSIIGSTRRWMLMLLGAVALVLLIACVNVANLRLARTSAREREFAIRAALGASRWQLARGLLVESILLSIAGTVCGVVLAWWGVDVLKASMPESLPRFASVGIDLRVLVVAAISATCTGIFFGVVPAIQASRTNVTGALKDGGRSSTIGAARRRLGAGLAVAEVALAVILLVGAGLFLSSFARFVTLDLGLDASNVLTVNASFRAAIAADDPAAPVRGRMFAIEMVERIRRLPGVESVAAVNGGLPLSGSVNRISLGLPMRPDFRDTQGAEIRIITPDYFRVLRIPLQRGRVFSNADAQAAPRVIILNEVAERTYFEGQDALGQLVNVNGTVCAVIGIVKGVRLGGPDAPMRLEAYVPVAQERIWNSAFVIRTSGPPSDALPSVKEAMRAVNSAQVISASRTLEDYFERLVGARRFNMQLMGLFGLLGIVIASVGLYGVMAQLVGQRTAEIGLRMALGAVPSQILKNVLGRATAYVAVGLTCGVVGALALAKLIETFLFQVQPNEFSVYAIVAFSLVAVGLAAAWLPARRASQIDPLKTLRTS